MIEFMQQHKELATGWVRREHREDIESLWKSLTAQLNAKGPPMRETGEWKKAWTDWKKFCRRKLEQPGEVATGITDYERIIIELCGFKSINNEEHESDENSIESATSSDTPLKMIKTDGHNSSKPQSDPLREENTELEETQTTDADISNTNSFSDQNRGRHRSTEQSRILLNFMQTNKDIANGNVKDKKQADILWQKLTRDLNNWGPPFKNKNAWKKAWSDWKTFSRKKNGTNLTAQEHCIIKLCDLQQSKDEFDCDNSLDEASVGSSSSNDALASGVPKCKKRKLKKENSIASSDGEKYLTEHLLETSEQDLPAETSTPSALSGIASSLAVVRASVVGIQTSLQELCSLMAEQNQELKKFFIETRRHHFVVEKEIFERKRATEK